MLHKYTRGFTFIELMVSTAIIVTLGSVVLYNYGTFNDNLALSSAGQEMAIAIRQAQIYALNVKESKTSSGQFSYAYGIYFHPTNNPTDYYIFIDSNGDKIYTVGNGCGGAVTECIEHIALRDGVVISAFGANSGCGSLNPARHLDITFLRPSTDADINFFRNNGTIVCGSNQNGTITLTSLKGKNLVITVENTGQIYVQ